MLDPVTVISYRQTVDLNSQTIILLMQNELTRHPCATFESQGRAKFA